MITKETLKKGTEKTMREENRTHKVILASVSPKVVSTSSFKLKALITSNSHTTTTTRDWPKNNGSQGYFLNY